MSKIFSRRDQAEMSVTKPQTYFEICMTVLMLSSIVCVSIGCTFGIASLIWIGIDGALLTLLVSIIDLCLMLLIRSFTYWWNKYDQDSKEASS